MNFRRWVVFTFLVHVLVLLVDKGGGLVLYLLCAAERDQHGKSSIAASLPFILGAIANLGLATSLVYFVRKRRYSPQIAFETTMGVALVWGGFVAILSAVVILWVLPWLRADWALDPWLALPICGVVPLLLVASYANSTQLATERIKDYGVVHLVTSLAFLPAFFACFFGFGGRVADGDVPLGVAWGRLASTFVVAIVALALVRKTVQLRARIDGRFLRDGLSYGWKANIVSTLTYLNHRVDLIVLSGVYFGYIRSFEADKDVAAELALVQVAFYSMSVTWAELVWHFPEAMRDLFFSKVAGSSHEQARLLSPVLSRLGLAISLVGAVAILLLLDPVMSTITLLAKGSADAWTTGWSPAVSEALLWLIPGTVAFTVSKVLQADLSARNQLQVCINAQVLTLATMLFFDFMLIPVHGALGAAQASTFAYVASTVYTCFAYCRQTGMPMWRVLVVHPSDFRYIREIVAAVLGKLQRSRT